MTTALQRLAGVFVAPAREVAPVHERVPTAEAAATVPPAIGVLAAGGVGMTAAAAVALDVIARARSRCALVCRWTGEAPVGGPAHAAAPAARSLAVRLTGRDLVAAASGRLVTAALPADAGEACRALERACAAAGEVPLVVLVEGPRPAALDGVLASLDRLVVVPPAGGTDALEQLAVADAARVGRAVGVLRVAPSPGVRALAARGLVVAPNLRAAARSALEGRHA